MTQAVVCLGGCLTSTESNMYLQSREPTMLRSSLAGVSREAPTRHLWGAGELYCGLGLWSGVATADLLLVGLAKVEEGHVCGVKCVFSESRQWAQEAPAWGGCSQVKWGLSVSLTDARGSHPRLFSSDLHFTHAAPTVPLSLTLLKGELSWHYAFCSCSQGYSFFNDGFNPLDKLSCHSWWCEN